MKQRNPNGIGNYTKLKDGRSRWKKTIDGKTRQLYAKSMPELVTKVKLVSDLPITKTTCTVDDWFQKWLSNYIEPLKRPATYQQYKIIYNTHIKPQIGFRKITGIKPIDIQSVIIEMNKKGLASSTMKHAKKIMNIAFNKAVEDYILPITPIKTVEIPNIQPKEKKVLSMVELGQILQQLQTSRWQYAVKFLLLSGLRRGEILALKWSDVDYSNNRISITKSNSSTGLSDTKTKIHYIPLSDKLKEYLGKQKEVLRKEDNPILFDKEKAKSCLIFPNNKGVMLQPGSFYTMMARAGQKRDIKCSPHMLRHTFVYMTRKQLSLKELQNILGHDESTTTLDIYGDLLEEPTKEVIKTIDEVFKEIDNISEVKKATIIDMATRKKIN